MLNGTPKNYTTRLDRYALLTVGLIEHMEFGQLDINTMTNVFIVL